MAGVLQPQGAALGEPGLVEALVRQLPAAERLAEAGLGEGEVDLG